MSEDLMCCGYIDRQYDDGRRLTQCEWFLTCDRRRRHYRHVLANAKRRDQNLVEERYKPSHNAGEPCPGLVVGEGG